MVVDGEDKCGIKGGVYQPKKISLGARIYLFLEHDTVRLRYWKLGLDIGEPCDISAAI
jgi:hypothetical protein